MADIEAMPSHPSVPLRILWLADDPRSSSSDLAKAVELDPALTARLLRMSNSAYYSLRTPVTNVSRAITVLGFSTVRSMAAAATAGLDDGSELPAGLDRKSVAQGQSVSVRVDTGGRRILQKKKQITTKRLRPCT